MFTGSRTALERGALLTRTVGFLWLLGLFCGCSPTPDPEPRGETVRLIVLHTNDIHGQVYPIRSQSTQNGEVTWSGGLEALTQTIAKTRQEARRSGAHLVVLDQGDAFQGTPEGDLPQGKLIIDWMNQMGYTALTLGNHEFDQGASVVEELARRAQFPFLAANLRSENTGQIPPYVRPFLILRFRGVRIAFVGLLTSQLRWLTTPQARKGVEVIQEEAVLEEILETFRSARSVDLVIVCSHIGIERDLELAARFPEVPLIIGGHSHTPTGDGLRHPKTGVLICQCDGKGGHIGRIDLEIDAESRKIIGLQARLIPMRGFPTMETIALRELLARYQSSIDQAMNEEVGELAEPLPREFPDERGKSSPLGNFLTDAMRTATGTDFAFHNRGGIRTDLSAGSVRVREMYEVSPFGNTLVTMKLRGSQIQALLEQALSRGGPSLEVSGLVVHYAPSAPKGSRVRNLLKDPSTPLEPDRAYTVTTNNFTAAGGDGLTEFLKGEAPRDTGIKLLDVQIDYFRRRSPMRYRYQNRFIPVSTP